ncbi:methylmalonyl-CoA/ethylmalonyl-CoA epimerase [Abditibacterium utsteinense]|uniref:Methylmalonyl-CoA/ethylmalonyl-CoA epimerase n=1 Tax=Abditibacterium utsteinense TaxID=1960156 RepID=A0A2S8SQY2_9BACT|nr:VOC family protein [Abditibacterium utsteinense]PQV63207.1 methylmalonyl-CoA/ethylmalonyl-CoA epimerase [Abditibacterium utsteinense]
MKIDHINLVVADLERSAAFYETVFGLKRGFSARLEGAWIETVTQIPGARATCLFLENPDASSNGGARIELIRYDVPEDIIQNTPVSRPDMLGLRHIAFEVEDLEATLQKMKEFGIEPLSAPVAVPFRVGALGTKLLCYLRDPDGVIVEIAAYHND